MVEPVLFEYIKEIPTSGGDVNMLYSFDVFDTVITRKTVRPDGIFAYMQDVINKDARFIDLPKFLLENFYDIRKDTERFVRELYKTNGVQEISIKDIYSKIKKTWNLSDEIVNELIELEYHVEFENVLPIPRTINKILDLKANGETVIFISDMYLPEKIIRKMLGIAAPKLSDIPLFVSCEYKKTKVSGDLYKMVADHYKVSYSEWVHEGDNNFSDIEVPDKMGISVLECRYKKLLPIEWSVYESHKRDYEIQVIIGAGANARLFESDERSEAFEYGSALLLPLLFSYATYIIDQCKIRSISDLFFIARDGYLIKHAVDKMICERNMHIETHYIYGSREAWRIPALSEDYWNIDLLGARSKSTKDEEIEDFAAVFGLSYDELFNFLPHDFKDRKILKPEEKNALADILQNDEKFKAHLLEKNRDNKCLAKKYLKQEIKVQNDRFAFVEFIGGGNTQTALAELLGVSTTPITTFYFSTTGEFTNKKCVFHQCYPVSISTVWQYEMFLVAPHGRTVGYVENKEGGIEPKLNNEFDCLREYGMDDFILGFEKALESVPMNIECPLSICLEYADYMWKKDGKINCDDDLLRFYGDMPYGVSGREKKLPRYGAKLEQEDFDNLFAVRTFEDIRLFYDGCDYLTSYIRMKPEDFQMYAEQSREKMFDDNIIAKRRTFWKEKGTDKDRLVMLGVPIDKLGKRVAVYGAGKFGRVLVEALTDFSDIKVVLWVDKNWESVSIKGYDIKPVEDVFSSDYDQVIIGIIKQELSNEVEEYLLNHGVNADKIRKILR